MARFDPFVDLAPFWNDLALAAVRGVEPMPMMKMDLTENETGYIVKAETPGANKEDITVTVDGGVVSISADVKREKEDKEGEKVLRSERYFGSVARSFTLPMDIDMAKATASYDGGVLTLMLPKSPATTSTRLAIH